MFMIASLVAEDIRLPCEPGITNAGPKRQISLRRDGFKTRAYVFYLFRLYRTLMSLAVCAHRCSARCNSVCQSFETEAQSDQQDAEQDREAADQPDHRQRPHHRL